jgi:hypothetical protein
MIDLDVAARTSTVATVAFPTTSVVTVTVSSTMDGRSGAGARR